MMPPVLKMVNPSFVVENLDQSGPLPNNSEIAQVVSHEARLVFPFLHRIDAGTGRDKI
jgi:hypothetical protein